MYKDFSFPTELALRYGVTEAIVLQHFADRLDDPLDEDVEQGNNSSWLKLSFQQLQADIPFLSLFKIRKAIEMLNHCKLILICDMEENETLKRRGNLYYGLTKKGYEVTHAKE